MFGQKKEKLKIKFLLSVIVVALIFPFPGKPLDEVRSSITENEPLFAEPGLQALVAIVKEDAQKKMNEFRKMKSRARSRYFWPQLKIGIDGDRGSDLTVSTEGDGVGTDIKIDQTVGYSADLSWNLPGTIFNSDAMNAYKEELRLAALLQENLFLLYELFAKRQGLKDQHLLSADEKRDLFTTTSRLNVLVGGIFDPYLNQFFLQDEESDAAKQKGE